MVTILLSRGIVLLMGARAPMAGELLGPPSLTQSAKQRGDALVKASLPSLVHAATALAKFLPPYLTTVA